MDQICGLIDRTGRGPDGRVLEALKRPIAENRPSQDFFGGRWGISLVERRPNRAQPLDPGECFSEQGPLACVFFGDLHNSRNLCSAVGAAHTAPSPAQAVLEAYRRFGPSACALLEGAFVLLLEDRTQGLCMLARDKLGAFPLYVHSSDNRLLFASGLGPLVDSGLIALAPDTRSLADYLTFQFPLEHRTFFSGIRALPPGTLCIIENGVLRLEEAWNFEWQPLDEPAERYRDRLRQALQDAVTAADTLPHPVSHLSGGLDSSLLALLLSKRHPALETFSGVYPYGPAYDESLFASKVAEHCSLRHTEVHPGPEDVIRLLPDMVAQLHEPVSDVAFSRYAVAKAIRDHAPEACTAFCGQGADELFGGYTFYQDFMDQRFPGGLPEQAYQRRRLFSPEQIRGILQPEAYGGLFGAYDPLAVYGLSFGRTGPILDRAAMADIRGFLPYWLQIESRIDAAVDLQPRFPFLHHDVRDLAARIPAHQKIRDGAGKWILRQAFHEDLPKDVLDHVKIGFRTPSGIWFKDALFDFASEALLAAHSGLSSFPDLFAPAAVKDMLEANRQGRANLGWQIWTMLLFTLWLDRYFGGKPCA
ncbi:asparagine synthetase B family protein [Desulfatiglans anilini]|uniref:asparagine synthetase B family protein n=1 Tax=Desulfatiglans anilini TaxID=90728 RepID=UPI0004017780|nr:asparagine synthase-related protein [Desulfatiglans anilini]